MTLYTKRVLLWVWLWVGPMVANSVFDLTVSFSSIVYEEFLYEAETCSYTEIFLG